VSHRHRDTYVYRSQLGGWAPSWIAQVARSARHSSQNLAATQSLVGDTVGCLRHGRLSAPHCPRHGRLPVPRSVVYTAVNGPRRGRVSVRRSAACAAFGCLRHGRLSAPRRAISVGESRAFARAQVEEAPPRMLHHRICKCTQVCEKGASEFWTVGSL